jgi:hypothetical protein
MQSLAVARRAQAGWRAVGLRLGSPFGRLRVPSRFDRLKAPSVSRGKSRESLALQ